MRCIVVNVLVWILSIMQVQAFARSVFRARLVGLSRPSPIGNWNSLGHNIQQSKWQINAKRFVATNKPSTENVQSKRVWERNTDRDQLFQAARTHDFDLAMPAFDALLASGNRLSEEEYCAAMSVCSQAEHIPRALKIAEQLKKLNSKFHEAVFLGLIRCYSAANQLNVAMQVLKKIPKSEMRPRYFQPMLEALRTNEDLGAALQLMHYMTTLEIFGREDQLTTLLQTCSRPKVRLQLQNDAKLRERLQHTLATLSSVIIGVDTASVVDIVSAYTNQSSAEVEYDGVLVHSVDDIQGAILSTQQLHTNRTLTAMNAVFEMDHGIGLQVCVPAVLRDTPITHPADSDSQIRLVREKYTVHESEDSVTKQTSHNTKFANSITVTTNGTQTIYTAESTAPTAHNIPPKPRNVTQSARIVDISPSTCKCPNCNGTLAPLPLSEVERKEVRDTLLKRVGPTNQQYLEDFGNFLSSRPEYEYIIDAANVAYQNQNFADGRFQYKQIEAIYDNLTSQHRHSSSPHTSHTPHAPPTPPRVLVILPEAYARKEGARVPNNVRHTHTGGDKHKFSHSVVSHDDARILDRFQQDDALYVCPRSTNDDIFWLYATLYDRTVTTATATTTTRSSEESTTPITPTAITTIVPRQYPGLVVSNDLMRDHKLHAFEHSRVFMRWRTEHIVNFVMRFGDRALHEGGDLSLFPPSKISREIQQAEGAEGEGYWHVPCVDRNVWLCVHAMPSMNSGCNEGSVEGSGEGNGSSGVSDGNGTGTSDVDGSDSSSDSDGDINSGNVSSSSSSSDSSSDSSDSDSDTNT